MLGELIADGRTSEVFRYGIDGAAKVLKPSTPSRWAQAEADYTAAVRELGVPAPEVRDVIDVDGRPAVVFERIDGPSMWQRMLDHPSDAGALTRELVEVQRSIHAAGVPDGLPSLTDRLTAKLRSSGELTTSEHDAAIELLASLPTGGALLHGDLHPGNVLLSASGPVVIDWFDATVGHRSADVARTILLLLSSGATDLRHLPGASEALVQRVHDAYVAEIGSSSADRVGDWCRLRAAGRLAERTDLDPSGLVALWRS
ncbi:MAG: phosphotransferase family protein [Ilumatobacter sp.]